MSQQHTTQASGQGMLERVFKLREHGTTARTEVIAGFTTFLTMVYIVFVNPQILGVAGMDTSAVFVTTCLIAAFGSIMMGLFANLPVALAPAMGLNAFFAFVVVQAMGLPWQVGMGAIFWGAIGLLLLTIFRVRYWMIANIPVSLRVGITSGIGLFIGMMGLKNAGVIVANPETLVSIGNLTSHSVLLGILGFFIIAILASRNIHAAVLVSIVVTTLLGWMLGDVHYNGIVSCPNQIPLVDADKVRPHLRRHRVQLAVKRVLPSGGDAGHLPPVRDEIQNVGNGDPVVGVPAAADVGPVQIPDQRRLCPVQHLLQLFRLRGL